MQHNKTDIPVEGMSFRKSVAFNLPNRITLSRLFLAVVFFVFLSYRFFDSALVVFFVAVLTDWLDGYYARKKGLSTDLGRIVDPFVDKVIICGGFIIFIHITKEMIAPWMVIVIVAREFFVSSIRGYSESKGVPFASSIWGKAKMFLQSVTIFILILYLAHFKNINWMEYIVYVLIWGTVIVTLVSGILYAISARKTLLAT
ncbi:MAG: CDP-diacylglycerol--glycerol-3-phosphate 3-phosphatidyltransferase [Candidatus Scalinduaceae bacterium]